MPKNPKQKQKLLYIMKFFLEKTDEEYGVTVADIIDYLDDYGITAERKSIYSDIECLRDFGMDIVKSKVGKISLFSLVSREFTLEEIKLLIDAVQSSKFITLKKSRDLIRKIETLASENQAKELHRQVIVANRVKNSNEEIYRNIDSINRAINTKRKIGFYYTQWAVSRTGAKKIVKVRRHDGLRYLLHHALDDVRSLRAPLESLVVVTSVVTAVEASEQNVQDVIVDVGEYLRNEQFHAEAEHTEGRTKDFNKG